MQKWHDGVSALQGRTWHIRTSELIRPDRMDARGRRLVHVGTVHAIPVAEGHAVGVALVADRDAFVRKIGHAIARGRALKAAAIMQDARTEAMVACRPAACPLAAWLGGDIFATRMADLRTLTQQVDLTSAEALRSALLRLCGP